MRSLDQLSFQDSNIPYNLCPGTQSYTRKRFRDDLLWCLCCLRPFVLVFSEVCWSSQWEMRKHSSNTVLQLGKGFSRQLRLTNISKGCSIGPVWNRIEAPSGPVSTSPSTPQPSLISLRCGAGATWMREKRWKKDTEWWDQPVRPSRHSQLTAIRYNPDTWHASIKLAQLVLTICSAKLEDQPRALLFKLHVRTIACHDVLFLSEEEPCELILRTMAGRSMFFSCFGVLSLWQRIQFHCRPCQVLLDQPW